MRNGNHNGDASKSFVSRIIYDKVKDASYEYVRRSKLHLNKLSSHTSATYNRASLKAKPVINEVTIVLKDNAIRVFDYAYRTVLNSEIESPISAKSSKTSLDHNL